MSCGCVAAIFSSTLGSFIAFNASSNAISFATVFIKNNLLVSLAFLPSVNSAINSFATAGDHGFFSNTKLPAYVFLPLNVSDFLSCLPCLSTGLIVNLSARGLFFTKSPSCIIL